MKLKFNFIFVSLFLLASHIVRAQNDVDFVTNKIISNYPGFRYKWKQSEDSFRNWTARIAKENSDDTFKALNLIVRKFRDQHLQIFHLGRYMTYDSLSCARKFDKINTYLKSPGPKKKREGYWINSYKNCVVGLKLVKSKPETYEAVVVENNNRMLFRGTVLGKMEQEKSGEYLTDYYSPFSKGRFLLTTIFRNDTVFTTGAEGKWRKLKNYSEPVLAEKWDDVEFYKAKARALDSNFYLVTLPGCSGKIPAALDSLLHADSAVLARTKTLIIDIRGNMGGRSTAWEPLLPWVYTNPIYRVTRFKYPNEDVVANWLQMVADEKKVIQYDSSDEAFVNAYTEKLRSHIGSRFLVEPDTFIATVSQNPKNVAVIMDFAVQSAAELLVLNFKQSSKVTFFGEHTQGAIDYLDFFGLKTPNEKYRLYIASTRRNMPAGEELDGIGIYPDVNISDNEPDWIDFVKKYYNRKEQLN